MPARASLEYGPMSDSPKKVEWYEVTGHDGLHFMIMVSAGADGGCTAVPCEVSLVRSSLRAEGGSPAEAVRKLTDLLAHKTRHDIFGGTS